MKLLSVAARAALSYLSGPSARKWEIALLAGLGAAVEQAIRAAL